MIYSKVWRFAGVAVLAMSAVAMVGGVAFAQAIAPTTPASISASQTGPSRITISWGAPSNDPNLAGYYVYRNGGEVANTSATSFIDTVQPGAYSYTVASYDSSGVVSPQSTATPLITLTADTTPPTVPANFTATAATSSIVLNWTASTDPSTGSGQASGVVGYYIYRNDIRISTTTVAGTTYTDGGLPSGYTYTYTVTAYDAAGNISGSSKPVQATTINDSTPPSQPLALKATKIAPTEIDISWQASTDNVGVVSYAIWRNGSQITTVGSSTTTYADIGLSSQTTYSYQVTASDAAGNVSQPGVLPNITTTLPDTSPPSTPGGLMPTVLSTSSVKIIWQPAMDNVGVVGYDVYRDGNQVGTASSTMFIDSGLASGTTYSYTVTAYDAAGNISGISFHVDATTWATEPAVTPPVAVIAPSITSVPLGIVSPAAAGASTGSAPFPMFTAALYIGLRSTQVETLQTVLIQEGDLAAGYATGYFGALTQKAVQQFQCAQSIVCSGTPATTGWGQVGAKTRKALNSLEG